MTGIKKSDLTEVQPTTTWQGWESIVPPNCITGCITGLGGAGARFGAKSSYKYRSSRRRKG